MLQRRLARSLRSSPLVNARRRSEEWLRPALPSKAEHYGSRTVAPVLARTSIQGATVPTFDAEKAWLQRASRAYDG